MPTPQETNQRIWLRLEGAYARSTTQYNGESEWSTHPGPKELPVASQVIARYMPHETAQRERIARSPGDRRDLFPSSEPVSGEDPHTEIND